MSDEGTPSFALRLFMGIAFAAAGLFPILAAFDVGPLKSSSINGPPWIGIAAGTVFLIGAAFLWFHGAAIRNPWLGSAFAFLIVAAFAALANWIAFGPGPRECSGSFSLAIFTNARWVPELECRAAFGIGAMMCNGLLVMIFGALLKQAGVEGTLPERLQKIGTGLLLIAFAPLLVVLVVATLAKALWESCRTYLRTGVWPKPPPKS